MNTIRPFPKFLTAETIGWSTLDPSKSYLTSGMHQCLTIASVQPKIFRFPGVFGLFQHVFQPTGV